jgi:DNA-binding transcriptional LysR family regulator
MAKLWLRGLVKVFGELVMDTELLKTFLEVKKTRHFGHAAENLYITQAAVSARIKQLEEILGVTLFIRKRNNIQLSAEGERLIPHAETMLLALARARLDVALPDTGGARIHLGVRTGIWGTALQQKMYAAQQEMPNLMLQVESLEPDSLTRMLLDRTLEVAILYELPGLPELQCAPIGELTLRLYSSRIGDTLESALGGNYVYLDWGGGFARFHERRFGELPMPVVQTNINDLASDYLVANGGACFLPSSLETSLAIEGVTPVSGAPDFVRQLNIAYHLGSTQRGLIEQFLKFFAKVEI